MTRTEFMDWCSQLAEAGRDVLKHSGIRTLGILAAAVRDATIVEDPQSKDGSPATATAEQVATTQTTIQSLVSGIEGLAALVSALSGGVVSAGPSSGGDGGPRSLVADGGVMGNEDVGGAVGGADGVRAEAQPWDAFAGLGEGGGDGGARQAYDAARGSSAVPPVPPQYAADTGLLRGAWYPGVADNAVTRRTAELQRSTPPTVVVDGVRAGIGP